MSDVLTQACEDASHERNGGNPFTLRLYYPTRQEEVMAHKQDGAWRFTLLRTHNPYFPKLDRLEGVEVCFD